MGTGWLFGGGGREGSAVAKVSCDEGVVYLTSPGIQHIGLQLGMACHS